MADTVQVEKRIEAIIISYQDGFTIYHNVRAIRLKGKDINLLIMPDYMPTFGEVSGKVELICDEEEPKKDMDGREKDEQFHVALENISGFFVIKNNVFKLLLKEGNYAN